MSTESLLPLLEAMSDPDVRANPAFEALIEEYREERRDALADARRITAIRPDS